MRSRLIAAAGPVFAAKGFDRATLRNIADSAGVNVALVSYYFGDKLGLYRDVIRSIRDSREREFPVRQDTQSDPRETLYRLVHTMLSRMLAGDSTGWESQLMMREMQQPTPVFESIVNEFFRPLYDHLTASLRRLLGDSVAPHVVNQLALSVVGQCVYHRCGAGVIEILIPAAERKAHYDIESLARHITAVTLSATQQNSLAVQSAEIMRLTDASGANRFPAKPSSVNKNQMETGHHA